MKRLFQSKTMGFALLVMLVQFLENNANWFQSLAPDSYGELAGYVVGLIIAVLRLITTKGIGKEPSTPQKVDDGPLKDF